MQSTEVPFAESRILQAIRRYEGSILRDIEDYLNRIMHNRGYDTNTDNAVCGLWMLRMLIGSDSAPIFHSHAGEDYEAQFNGPTCLSRNALYKAKAAAQAGMDSNDMANNPVHFLAVEGPYFPKGGAIVRRIGRVEFVISTSGFSQEDNHDVSKGVWEIIQNFLIKDVVEDLRCTLLDKDDPKYRKYPIGQLSSAPVSRPPGLDRRYLIHGA